MNCNKNGRILLNETTHVIHYDQAAHKSRVIPMYRS